MSRSFFSDREILQILHLKDVEGLTCRAIGERFGKSKNAIIGLLSRVNKETDASDPDGNGNGTMPPGWWR